MHWKAVWTLIQLEASFDDAAGCPRPSCSRMASPSVPDSPAYTYWRVVTTQRNWDIRLQLLRVFVCEYGHPRRRTHSISHQSTQQAWDQLSIWTRDTLSHLLANFLATPSLPPVLPPSAPAVVCPSIIDNWTVPSQNM